MEIKVTEPGKRTPLFTLHQQAGAKFTNFAGWDMPLHYGSQLEEHLLVRQKAGMFDVSHMSVVDITGMDARCYLRWLLANDVARLKHPGNALYSVMLNHAGGVIDDLIVYFIDDNRYKMVINCATKEKDLLWMKQQAEEFDVTLQHRPELAILAIQGPEAIDKIKSLLPVHHQEKIATLKSFSGIMINQIFFARTGYTGEDGLEIICSANDAINFWGALIKMGVQPCGLGARDSLRIEAGLNLYGAEMDETTSPVTAGLGWSIAWKPEDRNFCGRDKAEFARNHCKQKLVGLMLKERGMLRTGNTVHLGDDQQGTITSGSYSPILKCSVALAYVPVNAVLKEATVKIRNKYIATDIGSPRFIRKGKVIFKKGG